MKISGRVKNKEAGGGAWVKKRGGGVGGDGEVQRAYLLGVIVTWWKEKV